MAQISKRATIYMDPELHKILKYKSLESSKTISELVDEAIRNELREDIEDLQAFKDAENEESISFEELLEQLRKDGKI